MASSEGWQPGVGIHPAHPRRRGTERRHLGWVAWLNAALLVGAGITVLIRPDITLWALVLLAGAGLFRMVVALYHPDGPSWTLNLGIDGTAAQVRPDGGHQRGARRPSLSVRPWDPFPRRARP